MLIFWKKKTAPQFGPHNRRFHLQAIPCKIYVSGSSLPSNTSVIYCKLSLRKRVTRLSTMARAICLPDAAVMKDLVSP